MEQVEKVRVLTTLLTSQKNSLDGKGDLKPEPLLSEEEQKTIKDKILQLVSQF